MKANILYIEDDAIDIMSFERQLKNQNFWQYTIIPNLQNIDTTQHYTLIISDANFKNGTYIDAIQQFKNQQIIVISGSALNENEVDIIFSDKPFQFDQTIKKLYALNFNKIIEMADNDVKFINEITTLAKQEFSQNLIQLKEAYYALNTNDIKFFSHKLKSKINLFQIPCSNEINYLENNPDKHTEQEFLKAMHKTILLSSIAVYQLLLIDY